MPLQELLYPVFIYFVFLSRTGTFVSAGGAKGGVWSAKKTSSVGQEQASDTSAVIDNPIVPPPPHSAESTLLSTSCSDSSTTLDSSANSTRNIFEENICSKDISDSWLSPASSVVERVGSSGGGGVVVFDTKSCLARDQNANFITEVSCLGVTQENAGKGLVIRK